MFARFRQTPHRLQVSLVETRRVEGKVRHGHIASLGSIPVPWEIADRIAFWMALHERFARLSNRVSVDDFHKVMAAINDRIPMAMSDEQRQLQRENAEQELAVCSSLHSIHEGTLADHKALAATLAGKIAEMEAGAAQSAAVVDAAKERLAKIDRGEEVSGGLGKAMSVEDNLRAAGWATADIEHCRVLATLKEVAWAEFLAALHPALEKQRRAVARDILRRQLELEGVEAVS
jgi:hypothetical protein